MPEWAPCSGPCRKQITVLKSGLLRDHTRDVWRGGSNYEAVPCEGRGKPPLGAPPVAPVAPKVPKRVAAKAAKVAEVSGRSAAPRGALQKQQEAYAKLGLAWPPKKVKRAE